MKSTLLETHAAKGGGGGREWFQEDKPTSGFQNHLELRLGISLNNNNKEFKNMVPASSSEAKGCGVGANHRFLSTLDGLVLHQRNGFGPAGGTKRWLSETGSTGFIHPWSLAARQQKAIFEQAHQKSNPSSSSTVPRVTPPPPPPVVGWPPVRAFRRNLVVPNPPKPEMDGEKDAKKAKVTEGEDLKSMPEVRPTMFVKVNMEGFAVGRKINLKAHDSYESLSRTLQKMFNNFLSANYPNNSKQEEEDEVPDPDYILLYEDHEGDRMLVGDVPWEMFITSVKRLYIAHSPKAPKCEDGNVADDQSKP